MRADFAGHANAVRFGPADDVEPACGGDMLDVDASARQAGQLQVAGDADFLAASGDAGQTEPVGTGTLVHRAAAAQFGNFAMAGHEQVEVAGVFEGAAEKVGVGHRVAVIGDHDGPLLLHVGDVGQLLAGAALGDTAGGPDRNGRLLAGEGADVADESAAVDRRVGIGHGDDAGETAARSGPSPAPDRFFILASGLAQMHVHVEESGQENFSGAVDSFDPGGGLDFRCGALDFAVGAHEDVESPWRGVVGIDGESAVEQAGCAHEATSSFSSGNGVTAGCSQ